MRRLVVNDILSAIPGTRTFWTDLCEWFSAEFVGGPYGGLAEIAYRHAVYKVAEEPTSLVIRNATWFPPIKVDIPTISLLQDIIPEGPQRKLQEAVGQSSRAVVYNSGFTFSKYSERDDPWAATIEKIIPLPVDFSIFEPGNPMGLQQELSLPDGCICWIGACREAGHVKGFDIFLQIVRANPDLHFVAIFKDQQPEYGPPNLRMYTRLSHADLVRVIGACRVGLCTSRMESQHLAGIEMGACGLPMVAPAVGVYWKREYPGQRVDDPIKFTEAIRATLTHHSSPELVREHWRKEFDREVVKAAWTKLIEEVECSGAS